MMEYSLSTLNPQRVSPLSLSIFLSHSSSSSCTILLSLSTTSPATSLPSETKLLRSRTSPSMAFFPWESSTSDHFFLRVHSFWLSFLLITRNAWMVNFWGLVQIPSLIPSLDISGTCSSSFVFFLIKGLLIYEWPLTYNTSIDPMLRMELFFLTNILKIFKLDIIEMGNYNYKWIVSHYFAEHTKR